MQFLFVGFFRALDRDFRLRHADLCFGSSCHRSWCRHSRLRGRSGCCSGLGNGSADAGSKCQSGSSDCGLDHVHSRILAFPIQVRFRGGVVPSGGFLHDARRMSSSAIRCVRVRPNGPFLTCTWANAVCSMVLTAAANKLICAQTCRVLTCCNAPPAQIVPPDRPTCPSALCNPRP